MKISTRGRYSLMFMLSLAKYDGQGCKSVKAIATENNISDLYLEQLIGPLREAELVTSVRGARGGYKLNKSPEKIFIGEILRLVEGPIQMVEPMDIEPKESQLLWSRMTQSIKDILDTTSLHDLISSNSDELSDGYMFYI
ncbi:RrF2 family transcriptional regulator [Abyssicoccus albus]|uniref:RrF2 family transcriptional regulator n=1 Tax=Abyssicoccus albus TaxID=1817405 RepID=UPI00097E3E65|nr:Rrf2 family transcriptional regulator [Abyssicoccus albus]AQL56013.1 transcriptional regulator [Abyssicoccus albus]